MKHDGPRQRRRDEGQQFVLGAKGVETHSKKTVVFVQQTIENSFFQKIHTHEGFVPVEGKGEKERERERERDEIR